MLKVIIREHVDDYWTSLAGATVVRLDSRFSGLASLLVRVHGGEVLYLSLETSVNARW